MLGNLWSIEVHIVIIKYHAEFASHLVDWHVKNTCIVYYETPRARKLIQSKFKMKQNLSLSFESRTKI